MGTLADGATLALAQALPDWHDAHAASLWPVGAVPTGNDPPLPLQNTLTECQSAARQVSDQLCALFFTHSGEARYSVSA